MQGDQAVYDDIQFLTGSPQRRDVLVALCAEPARPHELCGEIDATRTTIQRILAGFRERQWVVKHEGNYRATVTGRLVCDRYEALQEAVERSGRVGPLAVHLGPAADDLPESALASGRLTVSEDGSPLAVLSRLTEWLRGAEGDLYATSPVVAQPFNEIGAELLETGTSIEFVIDSTVLKRSRAQYESDLQFGADHDNITVYVHDQPLSLGVAVDDERCCVVAYDDDNNMRAMLEDGTGDLHEWARTAFERHRERSVPLARLYDEGAGSAPRDGRTGRGDESAVED